MSATHEERQGHTSGPWTVEADDCFFKGVFIPIESDCRVVAEIQPAYGDNGELTEEDRANARLIAAAPEMLAALKALLHARIVRDGDVIERAQAIIASAEGRS